MKKINYSWEELSKDCEKLVIKIRDKKIKIENVYGIPRGGLIPAVILSHLLYKPLITNRDSIGVNTLVVDDVSDTGRTLRVLLSTLDIRIEPKPPTATLWKDKSSKFSPTFYCRTKEKDEWILYPFETIKSSKRDN